MNRFLITLMAGFSLALPWYPPRASQDTGGIVSLQKEFVARLTGRADIFPGQRLADRASVPNRAQTRDYLCALLDSLGLEPQQHGYREGGENVFAVLPATVKSDEYIVLGAHFDSVPGAPGANDNATGCAVIVGAAVSVIGLEHRSKNLLFVFFDEEERGLQGSRAFAARLREEGKNIVAVHTIDQMGWDADGDRAVELELPSEGAVALYEAAREAAGLSIQIHVTTEPGSDHSAFRRLGMPAVGLTEEYRNGDTTPYMHRAGDTWETVDFDFLYSSTRLVTEAMIFLLR